MAWNRIGIGAELRRITAGAGWLAGNGIILARRGLGTGNWITDEAAVSACGTGKG